MAEYIDKQAAIADLNETYDKMAGFHAQFYNGYQFAVNRLRVFPAAEVEPVRHGHWILKRQYHDADECNCSNCGQLMTTAHGVRMAYCPQCGFIMDGGNENEQD